MSIYRFFRFLIYRKKLPLARALLRTLNATKHTSWWFRWKTRWRSGRWHFRSKAVIILLSRGTKDST